MSQQPGLFKEYSSFVINVSTTMGYRTPVGLPPTWAPWGLVYTLDISQWSPKIPSAFLAALGSRGHCVLGQYFSQRTYIVKHAYDEINTTRKSSILSTHKNIG